MVEVDEDLQDGFFTKVDGQLQSIDKFFRKEEIGLQFSLSELEEKVGSLPPVCLQHNTVLLVY